MRKTFTSRCLPVILLGAALLSAPTPLHAQGPWTWASQTTSTPNGRSWTEDVAVDAAGDVYVTGAFQGTVTFGGAGTFTSVGIDAFVGKLNGATGAWIWVNQGLAPGPNDVGHGICVDNLGNVFVTGEIQGSAIQFAPFGPVPGLGPSNDVFVAQFAAGTGACLSLIIGGDAAADDIGHDIVYVGPGIGLPSGLYLTGEYYSPVAAFGTTILPNVGGAGTSDIFVARVGIVGAGLTWQIATAAGGPLSDYGRGITYSPSTTAGTPPSVYITGGFESPVANFGAFPLTKVGPVTAPSDIYAAKLDFTLGWLWATPGGGVGRDMGQGIVYEPISGDVYLTGGFEALPASFGLQTFVPSTVYGGIDVFVSRMNANTGAWVWTRQAGGLLDDSGYSIDRDPTGRVYMTGAFNSNTGQFGATTLPNTNTAGGTTDVFISKLNNAGGWMWSRSDGNPTPDDSKGIALGPGTTVHAGGSFFASSTFSPFTLSNPLTRTAWVGKLPGVLPSITISTPTVLPGGAFQNILVTGTGVATLTGPVFVAGTVLVQPGGVWTSNCNILSGPGNFNLSAGATINICSPQGISLTGPTGDIQVTGTRTFNSDANYRYVNPGGAQITGTGLTGARNLDIVTAGGVTQTQNVFVRRLVTMAPGSGNLAMGAFTLRLLSTATQTAMVINAPGGGIIVGAAGEHQRYIDPAFSAGAGYRHISSPMTNSVISQLTCPGFTAVVNAAFDPVTNPTPVPFPNVYGFFEAQWPASPTFTNGWDSPLALASPMGTGVGWSGYYPAPTRPTFRGIFQQAAAVAVGPLTQTGGFLGPAQKSGWALVGNPYPSPIDLGLITPPLGLSATASVWTTTGGLTGFYTPYPLGSGSTVLPVGQGFWVRALTSGPVLTFTSACRATAYANPLFYRPAPYATGRPTVRLTLASADNPALHRPDVRLDFAPDAESGLDARYDQPVPNHNVGHPTLLALTPQADELAVDGLPDDALLTGTTVPLLLDLPAAGDYELRTAELTGLTGTPVALRDRLTGTRYDLTTQATVRFTAPAGELRHRFEVVIGQRPLGTSRLAPGTSHLTAWPNPAHGTVRVTLPADAPRLTVLDVTGRVVRTLPATSEAVEITDLPAGIYTLRAGTATQRLVVE